MSSQPLFIKLTLPEGLEPAVEGLAREVIKSQNKESKEILETAMKYFEKMLEKRKSSDGKKNITKRQRITSQASQGDSKTTKSKLQQTGANNVKHFGRIRKEDVQPTKDPNKKRLGDMKTQRQMSKESQDNDKKSKKKKKESKDTGKSIVSHGAAAGAGAAVAAGISQIDKDKSESPIQDSREEAEAQVEPDSKEELTEISATESEVQTADDQYAAVDSTLEAVNTKDNENFNPDDDFEGERNISRNDNENNENTVYKLEEKADEVDSQRLHLENTITDSSEDKHNEEISVDTLDNIQEEKINDNNEISAEKEGNENSDESTDAKGVDHEENISIDSKVLEENSELSTKHSNNESENILHDTDNEVISEMKTKNIEEVDMEEILSKEHSIDNISQSDAVDSKEGDFYNTNKNDEELDSHNQDDDSTSVKNLKSDDKNEEHTSIDPENSFEENIANNDEHAPELYSNIKGDERSDNIFNENGKMNEDANSIINNRNDISDEKMSLPMGNSVDSDKYEDINESSDKSDEINIHENNSEAEENVAYSRNEKTAENLEENVENAIAERTSENDHIISENGLEGENELNENSPQISNELSLSAYNIENEIREETQSIDDKYENIVRETNETESEFREAAEDTVADIEDRISKNSFGNANLDEKLHEVKILENEHENISEMANETNDARNNLSNYTSQNIADADNGIEKVDGIISEISGDLKEAEMINDNDTEKNVSEILLKKTNDVEQGFSDITSASQAALETNTNEANETIRDLSNNFEKQVSTESMENRLQSAKDATFGEINDTHSDIKEHSEETFADIENNIRKMDDSFININESLEKDAMSQILDDHHEATLDYMNTAEAEVKADLDYVSTEVTNGLEKINEGDISENAIDSIFSPDTKSASMVNEDIDNAEVKARETGIHEEMSANEDIGLHDSKITIAAVTLNDNENSSKILNSVTGAKSEIEDVDNLDETVSSIETATEDKNDIKNSQNVDSPNFIRRGIKNITQFFSRDSSKDFKNSSTEAEDTIENIEETKTSDIVSEFKEGVNRGQAPLDQNLENYSDDALKEIDSEENELKESTEQAYNSTTNKISKTGTEIKESANETYKEIEGNTSNTGIKIGDSKEEMLKGIEESVNNVGTEGKDFTGDIFKETEDNVNDSGEKAKEYAEETLTEFKADKSNSVKEAELSVGNSLNEIEDSAVKERLKVTNNADNSIHELGNNLNEANDEMKSNADEALKELNNSAAVTESNVESSIQESLKELDSNKYHSEIDLKESVQKEYNGIKSEAVKVEEELKDSVEERYKEIESNAAELNYELKESGKGMINNIENNVEQAEVELIESKEQVYNDIENNIRKTSIEISDLKNNSEIENVSDKFNDEIEKGKEVAIEDTSEVESTVRKMSQGDVEDIKPITEKLFGESESTSFNTKPVHSVGNTLENYTNQVSSQIDDTQNKVTDTVEGNISEFKNDIEEQKENLNDEIDEKFSDINNGVDKQKENFSDKMEEKVSDFKNDINEQKENITNKVEEKVSDYKNDIEEHKESLSDKVGENVSDFKNTINEKKDDFADKVEEKTSDFKTSIDDRKEEFREKVEDKYSDFKNSIDEKTNVFDGVKNDVKASTSLDLDKNPENELKNVSNKAADAVSIDEVFIKEERNKEQEVDKAIDSMLLAAPDPPKGSITSNEADNGASIQIGNNNKNGEYLIKNPSAADEREMKGSSTPTTFRKFFRDLGSDIRNIFRDD